MAKRTISYAVVDAFTDSPFKGNPAAVCLLDAGGCDGDAADKLWMQAVAAEFNIMTGFLAPDAADDDAAASPCFRLRWFTPLCEVEICGHVTLAAAYFLMTSGRVSSDSIEFNTKSGLLKANKAWRSDGLSFLIELDFPVTPIVDCDSTEIPSIPETLNGALVVNVQKTATTGDLIVELSSGKEVAELHPNFDEISKCAGQGVIITGPSLVGSSFDTVSRFFCPKCGINEDPVCGSAHCALAPYWSKKLGKQSFTAFMASSRTGVLHLKLEDATQRVRIRGDAVTTMVGTLLV